MVEGIGKAAVFVICLHRLRGRNALGKLGQHAAKSPALFAVGGTVAVDGDPARDLGEKGAEIVRPRRGHSIPCGEVGIVDAFLRILTRGQNGKRERAQDPTVFAVGLGDRTFLACPVEIDDQKILHDNSPVVGFTQYVVLFPEKVTGKTEKIEKIFQTKKRSKKTVLFTSLYQKRKKMSIRARRRGFLCFARKKMRGVKNFSKKDHSVSLFFSYILINK